MKVPPGKMPAQEGDKKGNRWGVGSREKTENTSAHRAVVWGQLKGAKGRPSESMGVSPILSSAGVRQISAASKKESSQGEVLRVGNRVGRGRHYAYSW